MCNAHNHPPGCTCGWGGDGHLGVSTGGGYSSRPSYHPRPVRLSTPATPAAPVTHASYVNPNAKCPECGASVYFYASPYGGRVFFDELGPPWPKHPCTDRVLADVLAVEEDVEVLVLPAPDATPVQLPAWQSQGWEPFICKTVSEKGDILELRGLLPLSNTKLVLFTPSYAQRDGSWQFWPRVSEHLDLVMVRKVCSRAGRFVCSGIGLRPTLGNPPVRIVNITFPGYTDVKWVKRAKEDAWASTRSSRINAKLNVLGCWFLLENELPLEPFTLKNGQVVHHPQRFYDGLHAQLMGKGIDLYRMKRLAEKLEMLKRLIRGPKREFWWE